MDKNLRANLKEIPRFLNKSYDCVIIVTGHGKVRIGKTQVKGSKVLMASGGWKNVEDVKKGDEVISVQEDNSITYEKVIETHNRFEEDCYDVVEEATGKILYSCAGNHDIPIYKNHLKKGKYEYKLMEAKEVSKFSSRAKNQFYSLSSPAIEFKDNKQPEINPYTLGLWLGDGSFTNKSQLAITSSSQEIIDYLLANYEIKIYNKKDTNAKQLRFKNIGELGIQLSNLGLKGKRSGDKFIPKECLLASKEFRWKLLAGIIDTDGYCNKTNSIILTTKSKTLAEDVKNLTYSLGGVSSIRKTSKRCKNFVGEYFNVKISFTDNSLIPLKVKFKQMRLSKSSFERNHIYIKVIKRKPSEVYGFQITGKSHFYITDNWMITHNSTMAQQIGYYAAWLLAGGKKKPKKKSVPFNNTNIVFTPDQLVGLAQKLPKRSVIVYDEGRAGLDSIRAMENINKGMMDFFQECGQYQHVIIIVLPNYFRLSEDIAVPRSLFLVDVHHDAKYNRGYFKFYNEIQKEYLYVFGKKKLGTYAKYKSVNPSFNGRFTDSHPQIDVELYERQKREALVNKQKKKVYDSKNEKIIVNTLIKLRYAGYKIDEISELTGVSVGKVTETLKETREKLEKTKNLPVSEENEEEPTTQN
jgi:hypothetical protein